jgi:ParB/RepB/Spo0J family partition protein
MPKPGEGQMDTARLETLQVSQIVDAEDAARLDMDAERMAELKDSMQKMGLLEPLSVFPYKGAFQVLDGQRRLICARELGWYEIKCLVVPPEFLAIDSIRLHKNQIHAEMTAWEEAVFFKRLLEREKLDFEQLCRYVRKSQDYVSKRLVLLTAQPETIQALKDNRIPLGVALQLNRLKDRKWELYYLDQCLRSGTGTAILTGWISAHLARGGLEVRTQPTGPAPVVVEPPTPVGFLCCLCDHEHQGRQMIQTWIHVDELQTVRQVLAMQFKAMAERAEEEQPVEPPAAPSAEPGGVHGENGAEEHGEG